MNKKTKPGRPARDGMNAAGMIQMRTTRERQGAYLKAAHPLKLSEWMRKHLDAAANYTPNQTQTDGRKREANARLIAAAPDLLAALEKLLKNAVEKELYINLLEDKEQFDEHGSAVADYSPEMIVARAAIATAKREA